MSATELHNNDQRSEATVAFSPQDLDPEMVIVACLVHRITSLSKEALADFVEVGSAIAQCQSREEFDEIAKTLREILFANTLVGQLEEGNLGDTDTDGLVSRKAYIGGRIKKFREEAGWTQEDLSKKAGLPQSHISRLENGEHSPANKTLEKIATALGKQVRDLDAAED